MISRSSATDVAYCSKAISCSAQRDCAGTTEKELRVRTFSILDCVHFSLQPLLPLARRYLPMSSRKIVSSSIGKVMPLRAFILRSEVLRLYRQVWRATANLDRQQRTEVCQFARQSIDALRCV
jgi:hypothetical protein